MEAKLNLGLTGQPADIGPRDALITAEDRGKLLRRLVIHATVGDRRGIAFKAVCPMVQDQLACLLEGFP